MSPVSAPAKVLVTGANGFVAVWIVKTLLEHDYAVRGTVRSAGKGEYLANLFKDHGSRFEYAVILDYEEDGAFDDVVRDVEGVVHTAAPVLTHGTYDTIVKPTLESTHGILNSIRRHGANVRRAVLTSSVVAVMGPQEPGHIYTEADWNDAAAREVIETGENAQEEILYPAAKTLAERAAWEFVDQYELKFDVVTLLPPFVFGPAIHETGRTFSTGFLYDNLLVERTAKENIQRVASYVDVRDVAVAHVLALQSEKASGQRIIITAGAFCWQDALDCLAGMEPSVDDIPKGQPDTKRGPFVEMDTSKAATVLGLTSFRSFISTIRDTVKSINGLPWS